MQLYHIRYGYIEIVMNMTQHFLLSSKARTLSLAQVMRLTDEEAFKMFVAIRWAENGGAPSCAKCGSVSIYTYASRKIFKCKDCQAQFSATSGTIFASRKLAIRDVLAAIAIFANGAKGISALQLGQVIAASFPKPVQDEPSRLLSDADFLGELHGGNALPRRHQQVHGVEPLVQRHMAALKDGAGANREIFLALVAEVKARLALSCRHALTEAAARAFRPLGPQPALKVKPRGVLVGKQLEQLKSGNGAFRHGLALQLCFCLLQDIKLPLGEAVIASTPFASFHDVNKLQQQPALSIRETKSLGRAPVRVVDHRLTPHQFVAINAAVADDASLFQLADSGIGHAPDSEAPLLIPSIAASQAGKPDYRGSGLEHWQHHAPCHVICPGRDGGGRFSGIISAHSLPRGVANEAGDKIGVRVMGVENDLVFVVNFHQVIAALVNKIAVQGGAQRVAVGSGDFMAGSEGCHSSTLQLDVVLGGKGNPGIGKRDPGIALVYEGGDKASLFKLGEVAAFFLGAADITTNQRGAAPIASIAGVGEKNVKALGGDLHGFNSAPGNPRRGLPLSYRGNRRWSQVYNSPI